jgi:hypothetical protein
VQSLIPLFVTSKLSKIRKPSLTTPNVRPGRVGGVHPFLPDTCAHHPLASQPTFQPKTFVRSALRTLGLDNRTTGYLWHTVQVGVSARSLLTACCSALRVP